MAFYEEFKDRRKEFEIVAFHDARAKSLAEIAERTAEVKEKAWGGKDLPFPVLVDATGATIRAYEVSMFPTVLLVDPEGNLVRGGGEAMLRQKLMETSPAVRALVEKLAKAKEGAGRVAAEIAKPGDANALHALIAFARDQAKPAARPALYSAIAKVGGQGALVFLAGQVRAEEAATRAAAAAALGELGNPEVAEFLDELLAAETDDGVKKALRAALARLRG